jgi:hypothetical protein
MVTDKQKKSLFITVTDLSNSTWVINKREIVSAGSMPGSGQTRIVLTTGAIIDTITSVFQISAEVSEIEHKIEQEAKP